MIEPTNSHEIQIYGVGPAEADYAAPLLTLEAVDLLKSGDAFGMALVQEGEIRAAVCAKFLDEEERILEIVSIYTAVKYRRKGLGSTLFLELLELCMAETDGLIQTVTVLFSQKRDGLYQMLEKMGFDMEKDKNGSSQRITLAEIAKSPLMEKDYTIPANYMLKDLKNIHSSEAKRIEYELWKQGISDLTAEEILDISTGYALYDRSSTMVACIMVTGTESLCLSQFYLGNVGTFALAMMQAVAKELIQHYAGDQVLEIPILEKSSARLVQKILPDCQCEVIYRANLNLSSMKGDLHDR